MQTLEHSPVPSIDHTTAGLNILNAGVEKILSLEPREGLITINPSIVDIFGDPLITYEVEARNAMIAAVEDNYGSAVVITESLKPITIGENPQVLVAIDELDGTYIARRKRKSGLYGPAVAIFPNLDPLYGEAAFGGFSIINSRRTYYGDHKIAKVIEPLRGSSLSTRERLIYTSGQSELNEMTKLDTFGPRLFSQFGYDYDPIKQNLEAHGITRRLRRYPASIVHYARVADRDRRGYRDGAIEFLRPSKKDLEAAAGLPVIAGAGGDILVMTSEGTIVPMSSLRYREKQFGIMAIAATRELGEKILTPAA